MERHAGMSALPTATYFAGLERTLLELTAKLINPNNLEHEEKNLSYMSFSNTAKEFKKNAKIHLHDPKAVKEVNDLAKRLCEAAHSRNDILHSAWVAYSSEKYGQHRARFRYKQAPVTQIHKDSPINHIDKVTSDIDGLAFELACFEDRMKKLKAE